VFRTLKRLGDEGASFAPTMLRTSITVIHDEEGDENDLQKEEMGTTKTKHNGKGKEKMAEEEEEDDGFKMSEYGREKPLPTKISTLEADGTLLTSLLSSPLLSSSLFSSLPLPFFSIFNFDIKTFPMNFEFR